MIQCYTMLFIFFVVDNCHTDALLFFVHLLCYVEKRGRSIQKVNIAIFIWHLYIYWLLKRRILFKNFMILEGYCIFIYLCIRNRFLVGVWGCLVCSHLAHPTSPILSSGANVQTNPCHLTYPRSTLRVKFNQGTRGCFIFFLNPPLPWWCGFLLFCFVFFSFSLDSLLFFYFVD